MDPVARPEEDAEFVHRLKRALVEGLGVAGVDDVEVLAESIPGTHLHRITVVSEKFRQLQFSERQDLLWRIIRQRLTPEQELRISMILTLTPDDLAAA